MIYGREEVNIPSRFINEINEDLINVENVDEKKIVKKEKNIYTEDMMYSYGDKVMHDKFGLGVVVGINKDLLSVAFSKEIGIKQFLKNHKSIKKVD